MNTQAMIDKADEIKRELDLRIKPVTRTYTRFIVADLSILVTIQFDSCHYDVSITQLDLINLSMDCIIESIVRCSRNYLINHYYKAWV